VQMSKFRYQQRYQKKRKFSLTLAILSFAGAFLAMLLFLSYLVTPRVPIFGFHGIADSNNPTLGMIANPVAQRMSYPTQDLEKLLEYLIQNHYWFLSAEELHDFFITKSQPIPAQYMGQRPIMMTFDDSYKTVYTNVIPILKKLEKQYGHKAKMVLFINPATLAKPNHPSTTYLSCQDLRAGYAEGYYDVQSHGQNHKHMKRLNQSELIEELAVAQTQLRSCMAGLAPEATIAAHFAYPYGEMNDQVASIAKRYYRSAYLYNSRVLRFCWLKDRYRISRLTANRDKPVNQLIQLAERAMKIKADKPCPD
jgi:poly-beta-1,6-N-acetyl-D-glucosamine N-deacetylase